MIFSFHLKNQDVSSTTEAESTDIPIMHLHPHFQHRVPARSVGPASGALIPSARPRLCQHKAWAARQ